MTTKRSHKSSFLNTRLSQLMVAGWLLLLAVPASYATHYKGSTMDYEFVQFNAGDNKYEYKINATLIRDPLGTVWPTTLEVVVIENDGNNTPYDTVMLQKVSEDTLHQVPFTCVYDSQYVSLAVGIATHYEGTIEVDAHLNGYHLQHRDCCRNADLENIVDPTSHGYILSSFIPPTPVQNNSPKFLSPIIPVVCSGEDIYFSNVVNDPDGDSLVYSYVLPYSHTSQYPPYDQLIYQTGYTTEEPFGPGSIANIDATTGRAMFHAPVAGSFLVGIQVSEYRGGQFLGSTRKELMVQAVNCNAPIYDCVYPGDADHLGISNAYDILPIAVAFNATGDARPDASLDWYAQTAPDWTGTFRNGLNYKHADCNGDGIINENDASAILDNYNQLNNKRSAAKAGGPNDPPLYLQFSADSVMAGDTATVSVMMGVDTNQMDSAYAMAFTIAYDPTLVDSGSIQFDYSQSWLGTVGLDLFTIEWHDYNTGQIEVGIARKDKKNRSGNGAVASFQIIMIDDLSGKSNVSKTFAVELIDAMIISSQEDTLPYNLFGDSAIVFQLSNGVPTNIGSTALTVYPNPATDQVVIDWGQAKVQTMTIHNIAGVPVHQQYQLSGNRLELDTEGWATGIYLIRLQTDNGILSKKMVLMD